MCMFDDFQYNLLQKLDFNPMVIHPTTASTKTSLIVFDVAVVEAEPTLEE